MNKRLLELTELYRTNGWDELIVTQAGIPIPFKSSWKRIGFNISGGADSAILFFNVAKYVVDHNLDVEFHTVSHIRCWKTRPWQRHIRLEVIKKLRNMFPSLNIVEHENYIAPEIEMGAVGSVIPHKGIMKSGDQLSNSSYSEFVAVNNKFDAFYCGTTSNPDILSDAKFGGAPDRNLESVELNYNRLVNGTITHIRPYTFLTKDVTIRDYFMNGVLYLLNATRSCEQDDPELMTSLSERLGINNELVKHRYKDAWRYYRGGDTIPECGEHCFWCIERAWAINER